MTRDEIIAYQEKERAFIATPIGKAFNKFKNASAYYWQCDCNETISSARLRKLSETMEAAETELRALIEPIAMGRDS